MNNPNTKIYLAISGALIFLFILILIIPFTSRKTPAKNDKTGQPNQVFPTSIEANPSPSVNRDGTTSESPTPPTIKAGFTGAAEEQIPQQIVDAAAQKKDLRQKSPLILSVFTIDFDYAEDKFNVTLKDPKDQSQKEFESWRTANYPGIAADQFLLK
jgi:hypothetical protein